MKKIVILQSNYIPWKGYFDLIAAADEFIFYDDAQYTKNDWRNRNKIKTQNGVQWLTVPVSVSGSYPFKIKEAKVINNGWHIKHWKSIQQNYGKAPYYKELSSKFNKIYEQRWDLLIDLNRELIATICSFLAIATKLTSSSEYNLVEGKSEKLVSLCQQAGGTEYISGPAAKSYLDESLFEKAGIKVTWFDYSGYPTYPQLHGDFVHEVSILDLLFNCGAESRKYMHY